MTDDVIDNRSPGQRDADAPHRCEALLDRRALSPSSAATNILARRDRIPVTAGIYLRA
jgi:hypothetical protein